MFEPTKQIALTAEEFSLIEAGLQTQAKILRMQAGAGSTQARARHDQVNRLLARLEAEHPSETETVRPAKRGMSGFLRRWAG